MMDLDNSFPAGLPLLLAFDLDGTLIAEGSVHLPTATATALARLRGLGVKLAIVTGRDMPPESVLGGMQPHAVATNNGGRVELGGELHTEAHFDPADLRSVLAHELGDARTVVFTSEGIFVDLPAGLDPEPWMAARSFRPLAQAPTEGILKVGFYHPNVAAHAQKLRQSHPHLVMTGGQPPYTQFLTVTPTGADKAAALTLIAQALAIPLERTVAFGDSDNDEVMLEVAGYAVQVGHLPLLTRHANATLPDHLHLAAYLNQVADRLELTSAQAAAKA